MTLLQNNIEITQENFTSLIKKSNLSLTNNKKLAHIDLAIKYNRNLTEEILDLLIQPFQNNNEKKTVLAQNLAINICKHKSSNIPIQKTIEILKYINLNNLTKEQKLFITQYIKKK
jgi:hypothetical protein